MKNLLIQFMNDEAGFIVSAELVLISTIAVLAMIVGLSEVAHNINQKLEDWGSAFGRVNQSFYVAGASGHKGSTDGSRFRDRYDFCDSQNDIVCDKPPVQEGRGYNN
jgi:Flp pilus assembly pilin Flp